MALNPIVLKPEHVRQIEEEGAQTYPNECCGILIGRDLSDGTCARRIVERLEPMRNVYDPEQQRRRFAVDPLAQLRAEKAADAQGMVVLGYYHSHPDHPARPSETDREAAWPFYSYVIVSIAQGKAVDMTSWVLEDESRTFSRQDIVEE